MNNYICYVILVCLISLVSSDDYGDNAVAYSKESFDEAIAREDILFVMFYAPWCGHCKRLAPTWDDLAKEYNVENRQITVGKVDCTKETALCGEHHVRGYPTVKWFHKSNLGIKYANKRTIEDLRAFVEESLSKSESLESLKGLKQVGENTEEKTEEKIEEKKPDVAVKDGLYDLTDDTFDAHVSKGHHFVKFYAPWCGHCKRLAPTWEQLASTMANSDKVKIGKVDCTVQQRTCQKFNVRGYPTLMWITDGVKNEDYRGQRSIEDLSKFVAKMSATEADEAKKSKDGSVPNILEDEPEVGVVPLTDEDFTESVSEDFTLVIFDTDDKRVEAMMPTLEKLAERYVDNPDMLVAVVDCKTSESTCKNQEANGPYPQYMMYHNGAMIDSYRGEKTVVALGTYVDAMMKQFGGKHDEL